VKSGKKLARTQIEVLQRWIAEGAEYQPHWAFIRPIKPAVPTVADSKTTLHNDIDRFVIARLAEEGLEPSPEADRRTLIRRVSLDLTGLPPAPEEVHAFLTDTSPDAYEKLVDRLLASPRYGEHLATWWLDLARYADTSGFQGDPYRTMWRWRDYVIDSFNANKHFDQFTLEQIAGDLLPNATMETRLATGFHRNHRFNTEFGAVEEEWKVENVIDRIETVSMAWLGLTMGCARCHDHKYDPVLRREFYQFFAFFNNVPERGVYWDVFGDDFVAFDPAMRAPVPTDALKIKSLEERVRVAEKKLRQVEPSLATELAAWETTKQAWSSVVPLPDKLVLHLPLDRADDAEFGIRTNINTVAEVVTNRLAEGRTEAITNTVSTTNVTVFADTLKISMPAGAQFESGALGRAWRVTPDSPVIVSSNILDQTIATIALWIRPETNNGVIFAKFTHQKNFPLGLSLSLTNGRVHFELSHEVFDFDGTMVPVILTTQQPVPLGQWTHVAILLDGNRRKRGPTLFINGDLAPVDLLYASVRGLPPFANDQPLELGAGPEGGKFTGLLDDFRIYDRALTDREVNLIARLNQAAALALPPAQRTPEQQRAALEFYRDFISPTYRAAREAVEKLRDEKNRFEETLPLVMVMQEKPTPPTARVLFRGQYDQPQEAVTAGLPAALGTLPKDSPANRLGLARWLVSPDNPLTARVTVNRIWERFFGLGLVRTTENIGTQAGTPSHPELLDWLGMEFVCSGWDLKALHKLIALSATYRQSSRVSANSERAQALDPENRLLWRGPRFRISAEAIRDEALLVSGLLVEKVGGPSVTSYLPGRKVELSPDLYRRSLYSFWQRTKFNPSMGNFDATAREACTVRRQRTNTPLQALTLLNEVTYVEAARKLGERMMKQSPDAEARLRFGFELALCREPTAKELAVLDRVLRQNQAIYRADQATSNKLLAVGASKCDGALDPTELAAYSLTASIILNLDEFITKE
jgi:hypothetical protein